MTAGYKANSITLRGAVAMGTGVMIGAGIFALTGQKCDATEGTLYDPHVAFPHAPPSGTPKQN